jgi:hypothetical protein
MLRPLADVVLVLHVGFAAFVIGGLLVVPLGTWLNWRWVGSRRLRLAHLLCTATVAVEALIGMICPLTWLEHALLVASGTVGYERSFIGQLLYWILYYDAPAWAFTVTYTFIALLAVVFYFYLPPLPKLARQRS